MLAEPSTILPPVGPAKAGCDRASTVAMPVSAAKEARKVARLPPDRTGADPNRGSHAEAGFKLGNSNGNDISGPQLDA